MNRIGSVVWICSDADANSDPMGSLGIGIVPANNRKLVCRHSRTYAFGSNEALSIVGVQQKGRKLLATKTRCNVSSPHGLLDDTSCLFQRPTTNKVAVTVVNFFEVV